MKKLILSASTIIVGCLLGILLSFLKVPNYIIYFLIALLCTALIFFTNKSPVTKAIEDTHERPASDNVNLDISLQLSDTSKNMYLETKKLYEVSETVFNKSNSVMQAVEENNSDILNMNKGIETISTEIDKISVEASTAHNISNDNINAVESGKGKINTAAVNMTQLVKTNEEFISIVAKLDQSSQSIYTVIEYIDQVAQKTNMLSLNASIEAARAGEYGKGFMVITQEIKKLAEQSVEFSSNIKTFLSEIRENIRAIENITSDSSRSITSTNSALDDVELALDLISKESSALDNNVYSILSSSTNIKNLGNSMLNNAKALTLSHDATYDLMKGNLESINDQWNVIESFKSITENINKLSDDFLSKNVDKSVEDKLIKVGKDIMNYNGDKNPNALKELASSLGVVEIFYANKQGVFEYATEKGALGLNIFELDKRYKEFVNSDEVAKPYPLSRRFDTGELYKFMAVKRADGPGVISVGLSIKDLLKL